MRSMRHTTWSSASEPVDDVPQPLPHGPPDVLVGLDAVVVGIHVQHSGPVLVLGPLTPGLVHVSGEVVARAEVRDLLLPDLLELSRLLVEHVAVRLHAVVSQGTDGQDGTGELEPPDFAGVVLELHVMLPHRPSVVPANGSHEGNAVGNQEIIDSVPQHILARAAQDGEVRSTAFEHDGIQRLHVQFSLCLLANCGGQETADRVPEDCKAPGVHGVLHRLKGIIAEAVQGIPQLLLLPYSVARPLVGRYLDLLALHFVSQCSPSDSYVVASSVETEEPELWSQVVQIAGHGQHTLRLLWKLGVLG
mmetsp:Transcript_75718/g.225746  ORF Transcript_75718/g.225746 Transcript_75718/m.225746 type:complete len:305 (+) Transcript_75718:236-1150(+)